MISVLGAGVAGLCAATTLAERGMDVEVVMPDDAPQAASALAGGMLAPFCEGESAPSCIVTRGQASLGWWADRSQTFAARGTLVVAPPRDAAELDRFASVTRAHRWVTPVDLEPDLEGRFARGLFFPDEAHLDPREALSTLRDRLVTRGVRFVRTAQGRRIVDCRGLAAADQLNDLRPVRGEMLEILAPGVTLSRPVRLLHPRFPCYIVPRGGGRYMIGATMIETSRPGGITARAAMELLSAAYALHPAFAEGEILSTGAGHRPAFPDNIPALRRIGDRFHLNGMYRHGFLMAPVLAMDLAKLLQTELAHAH